MEIGQSMIAGDDELVVQWWRAFSILEQLSEGLLRKFIVGIV